MMTELEKRFMMLGCNFFRSQANSSDFIEIHACEDCLAKESKGKMLINKHAIIAIVPLELYTAKNLDEAAQSIIHTASYQYLATETYEELKQMLS